MAQQTMLRWNGHTIELDPNVESDGSCVMVAGRREVRPGLGRVKDDDDGPARYGDRGYYLPTDAAEQDRLDEQHTMFLRFLRGKLGLAPVASPRHVLDVGTGTGIWAIQYAKQHPESSVVGVDLHAIRRESHVANCSFIVLDVEREDWPFAQKFDYIHLRYVHTCFDDTKLVLKKAFDFLSPGGYIEVADPCFPLADFDGTLQGTALQRWMDLAVEGAKDLGRDLRKPKLYPEWCRDIGFVDVSDEAIPQPFGTWSKNPELKDLGRLLAQDYVSLIGTSLLRFVENADLPQEQLDQLLEDAMADVQNPRIHSPQYTSIVIARKPELSGGS